MLTMKRMVILVGVLLIVCSAYVAHVSLLDGVDGTLLSTLLGDDTVYAEGTRTPSFDRLHWAHPKKRFCQFLVRHWKLALTMASPSSATPEARTIRTITCALSSCERVAS